MSFAAHTSILQAISFLTRPLSFARTPSFINVLQSMLRTVLGRSLMASPSHRLLLPFTSTAPPREIGNICNALGLDWTDWIEFFGQQNFDLLIEADQVIARYPMSGINASPLTVTIWHSSPMTPSKLDLLARLSVPKVAQVPVRKPIQQVRSKPMSVATPPHITLPSVSLYPRVRTVAQQLIDSDDEEELFAMISKTSIICPTPTREMFAAAAPISPFSSPEPSESSRPSSRTSTFSGFSEEGSLSSVSPISVESLDAEADASFVFVDPSKKDKTKYLYQGGVSSTLTGGVMLGRPSAKSAATPAPPQKKHRVPAARAFINLQKYSVPNTRPNAPGTNAWSRAAPFSVGPRRF